MLHPEPAGDRSVMREEDGPDGPHRRGVPGVVRQAAVCWRRRVVVVVALWVVACTLHRAPDGPPGRFADGELVATATRIDQNFIKAGVVFPDRALDQYLAGVVARIAPAEANAITVRALRDSTVNAYALPNGSIWMNAGMFAHLADESQLAFVVGHEIAHLRHRHSMAATRERTNTKVVSQLAGLVVAPIGLADPASNGLYSLMVAGYGRQRETDADHDGLEQVAAAGYPLATLPAFFDAMDAVGDEQNAGVYSDHPSNAARKAALEGTLRQRSSPANPPGGPSGFRAATRAVAIESAHLCLQRGDARRALAEIDTLLAADPNEARVHVLRGDTLRRLASPNEEQGMTDATAAYERALTLDPAAGEAHRGLGYIALKRGDKVAAHREFERYLESTPNAADRRFVRAVIAETLAP